MRDLGSFSGKDKRFNKQCIAVMYFEPINTLGKRLAKSVKSLTNCFEHKLHF